VYEEKPVETPLLFRESKIKRQRRESFSVRAAELAGTRGETGGRADQWLCDIISPRER
jgi:hypothetical protein